MSENLNPRITKHGDNAYVVGVYNIKIGSNSEWTSKDVTKEHATELLDVINDVVEEWEKTRSGWEEDLLKELCNKAAETIPGYKS